MAKTGRPSSYTQAIADSICKGIAEGKPLVKVIETLGVGAETVYRWLRENAEFREQYARAREDQADYYADEIVSIADTEYDAVKARVRIDARKWVAGKLRPKKYGDKISQEITGANGGAIELRARTTEQDEAFALQLAKAQAKLLKP